MRDAFKKLDPSRQAEILNAALDEFAQYGYKDASTNRIVKHAGMSKGMLYYYFENKEDVYFTCTEYTLERVRDELLSWDLPKQGFIERSAAVAELKHKYYAAHPEISMFLSHVYLEDTVPEKYRALQDALFNEGYKALYADIDYSFFRDDIDHDVLMQLIKWTFDGYSKHIGEVSRQGGSGAGDFEKHFRAFGTYLDAMKKIYYKEEYQ
ncbi:TetR/AcrR family transcriptional regulator [Lacicoccus alkaliphilus]|uniref:Transcriptional regulator, TetR family n=1 Tax=Lacicoccus alkaliphilus DSM 16010 TaxID=1123231 RepID=A0A1M7G3Y6_9BACL|nr:TetR/AcrR family transcriptional regulator [Salinicoccus alkaliphilus]SHM11092.1 transcriptional regulator, TetR family [Salinicoccus alkaliphilus DSM 16010]